MAKMENAHALVIGIQDYPNINKLSASVLRDAKGVYDLLLEEKYCGYPIDNVDLLLNHSATKDGILSAFDRLAGRSDPDSVVFIYLSSHGARLPAGEHEGQYILPIDTDGSSIEGVAATAISGDAFTTALEKLPARKVLVLFDCCHSGGIGQIAGAGGTSAKSGLGEDLYDQLKKGRGRVIIASSRGEEESYIKKDAENSLFTTHLLEGLKGGIQSEGGVIKVFDLFEYIQPKITLDHPMQHPVFKAEIEENFAISLFQGGAESKIERDMQGYQYDVYINYTETDDDDDQWVWDTLIPRCEEASLKVAVSENVKKLGVARVVSIERGIKLARRTLLVFSDAYFKDNEARFLETVITQISAIEEASHRVVPLIYRELDTSVIPTRLSMLGSIDLTHPRRGERRFNNLLSQLGEMLPEAGYF